MGTLDVEAEALRASVRSLLFGEVGLPCLGRYQLQQRIGRGGMGVVYAARDPELGRTVALKVLRPHTAGGPTRDGEARLLQEARALARLSHPNVVSVYAVERIDGVVCIAMEYIRGTTLAQWLAEPHPASEVVSAFIEAGRGLAAAHLSGLVHRDFKPPNVMVGAPEGGATRGRGRVLDFGLARADWDLADTVSSEAFGSGNGSDGAPTTETGMVMGTRGYMAPELTQGPATAASDQYAFFLSFYDAVGRGRDASEPRVLLDTVPRRFRSIVARGLAKEPNARWPTMDEAIAALEHASARGRWRWGLAGLACVGVLGATSTLDRADDPCAALESRVIRTWNAERSAGIRRALGSSPAFVVDAWDHAGPRLDATVAALADEATHACASARPDEATSLCFEMQLLELDGVLRHVEAHPETAEHSLGPWLAAFDPLRACAEASQTPWSPASQRVAEALAEIRGQLRAARYAEADAGAERLLAEAHVQPDDGLRSESLLLAAQAARATGAIDRAQERLRAALQEASGAGLDSLAAQTWILSVEATVEDFGRIAEAERMLAPARAAVARAGHPPLLEADLAAAAALVAERSGDPEGAVALYRSAIETYERTVPPSHPRLPTLLHGLARALRATGRPPESLAPIQRALAASRDALGPRHPDVARHLVGIGSAAGFAGDHTASLEAFDQAVSILTEALGPEHPNVAVALHDRGNAYASLRRFDEAHADLSRASALDRNTLGPDNPGRTQSLYALAMVQRFRGELDDAQALMEEALEVQERAWGTEHPDLAYVVSGLADLAAVRKDYATATALFARARTLLESALGAEHPRLVHPLLGAGRAEIARQAPHRAAPMLADALRILDRQAEAGPIDPLLEVEVLLVLAQARAALDPTPQASQTLLTRAKARCEHAQPSTASPCDDLETWTPL